MFPAFLTTIFFSISAVCGRQLARLLPGSEANFWRLSLATLALGLMVFLGQGGIQASAFPLFFVSGCIGFGIGDLALFQALPRLGSRLSVLIIHCLAAPIAALTEWIWLGTILSTVQMGAGFLILLGVAMAIAPGAEWKNQPHAIGLGVFFAVIAALGQALGAVLSRRADLLARTLGEDVGGINAAFQRIIGGVIFCGIFLLLLGAWRKTRKGDGQRSTPGDQKSTHASWRKIWPWLTVNGLAGPVAGVSCYQWALKEQGTGVVLPIVAITPLVVIPFSQIMEKEKLTLRSLLGGILAVAGAVLLAFYSRR